MGPEAEVRRAIAGNLCRCTGYVKFTAERVIAALVDAGVAEFVAAG